MKLEVKDMVYKILEDFPVTRNSDLKLFSKIMNIYYGVLLSNQQVEKMLKAISYASIIRERAKIQNKHCQLQPSLEVKIKRHQLQGEYRNRYGKHGRD